MVTLNNLMPSIIFWSGAFASLFLVISKRLKPVDQSLLNSKDKPKATKRILKWERVANVASIVHSIAFFLWGLYLFQNFGVRGISINLDDENSLIIFSFSYYIVEALFDLAYEFSNNLTVAHRIGRIAALAYVLLKNRYANIFILTFGSGITGVLRLLKRNLGRHRSAERVSALIGLLFCMFFVYSKVFLSGSLMLTLQESRASLLLKMLGGFDC